MHVLGDAGGGKGHVRHGQGARGDADDGVAPAEPVAPPRLDPAVRRQRRVLFRSAGRGAAAQARGREGGAGAPAARGGGDGEAGGGVGGVGGGLIAVAGLGACGSGGMDV